MSRSTASAGCIALAAVLLACGAEREAKAPVAEVAAWSAQDLERLRSLSLASLPDLEPRASNRFSTDERAARLGERLFFDPALSSNGQIACATCHVPELHFTDGRARALGLAAGARNTPTVVGAAYSPWQFRDGRRDSLWAQALVPLEAQGEMGSSRLEVVRYATGDPRYRAEYAELFGDPPQFDDAGRFPGSASPYGSEDTRSAWARLEERDREAINVAFANVGKAIAAFERHLLPSTSAFDRYVDAIDSRGAPRAGILSDDEVAGLRLFVDGGRTQCMRCHNGPLLANHEFHDIASGGLGSQPDLGRFVGIQSLLLDPFNCLGPYSDAKPTDCDDLRFLDRREIGRLAGAFRTPSLRDVARTAPYFHDGSALTLEAVIEHYRNPPAARSSELTPLDLDDREAAQLVAFLRSLSGNTPGVAGSRSARAAPPPSGEQGARASGDQNAPAAH